MGVIQRQSVNLSIVKIIGLVVGSLSILFIYPLNHDLYGYIQFLFGTATLLVPIVGFGFSETIIKFFSEYQKHSHAKDSFILLGYFLNTVVFFILGLAIWIFGDVFFDYLREQGYPLTKVRANVWYLLVMAFMINNCMVTTSYISNYGRIAIPTGVYEVGYKVLVPSMVMAGFLGIVFKKHISLLMIGFFACALLGLIYYGYKLGAIRLGIDLKFLGQGRRKSIITYSLFSALTSIGAVMAFRVDALMITEKLNESATGLYFNVLMIAAVIDIPSIAMAKIAGPVVSQSWDTGNVAIIQDIYCKSSRNALIVGGLIFLGLLFNIDDLLSLSAKPEVFVGAGTLFLYLGIAKLIDGATGLNNKIISYSKHYRYNLIFLLILALLNVVMNIIFIDKYGVVGAAIATCLSITVFNLMKIVFIRIKFGLSPFDRTTWMILAIGAATAVIVSIVPVAENVFLAIIWKSTLVTLLFAGSIYLLKLSPDINKVVDKNIARLISI